jgi:hypothetical protein
MLRKKAPPPAEPFHEPLTIERAKVARSTEKAVRALASYLTACKIPWALSTIRSHDLDVIGQDGTLIKVVVLGDPKQEVPSDTIAVPGWDLISPSLKIAFSALHKVTEPGGYGTPEPVDRGPDPDKKLCYKDDHDLVAMRHWPLRTAPNLPDAVFKDYTKMIENLCRFFYNTNRRFMDLFGYTVGDLLTFAMVWLVIFQHHHAKLKEGQKHENRKLFTEFVKQKFIDFRTVVQSKANGCFPNGETLVTALYEENVGGPPLARIQSNRSGGAASLVLATHHDYDQRDDAGDDEEYQRRHNLLDKSSENKRRKSAALILAELLGKLPHDEFIEKVKGAALNDAFCYDTRMEARRQLRKHVESCSVCPEDLIADLGVEEHMSGSHSVSN